MKEIVGKRLVLAGGGHAHLTVLAKLGELIAMGHRVTLVSPSGYHYYSGMGPGLLAGIYDPREVRFNVKKMVQDRGGSFLEDRVVRIDPENRELLLESGRRTGYDVVSFNVGSEVAMGGIAGFDARIVPVKPIANLAAARRLILDRIFEGLPRLVVVGGGPSGVEIAGGLWRLARDQESAVHLSLISGGRVLAGFPPRARRLALSSLAERRVEILEGARVTSFDDGCVVLADGRRLRYDWTFLATGVIAPKLFAASAIPVGKDGGLSVNDQLRSTAYPEIFGAGDCIGMESRDLSRIGVHAVRESSILYRNLVAALNGGEMKRYLPRRGALQILNMGDGRGILWKKDLVLEGRLAFLLKDTIDRRFMKKFQVSGELHDDDLG